MEVYANGKLGAALNTVGSELRFWFITSDAKVQAPERKPADAVETKLESGETVWIVAKPSSYVKCDRCWHQRADVGANAEHPGLCGRCVENVAGQGETRRYI